MINIDLNMHFNCIQWLKISFVITNN